MGPGQNPRGASGEPGPAPLLLTVASERTQARGLDGHDTPWLRIVVLALIGSADPTLPGSVTLHCTLAESPPGYAPSSVFT
jgi:hypothetical protein